MANFSMNKVILGGRLSSEIELNQTQSGISVASFSIAVNRRATQGKEQETDFFKCTAWRGQADMLARYFKKGSSICIEGAMQNRTWTTQDGQKRTTTEIVVSDVYFVDSKSESATQGEFGGNSPTLGEVAPNFEEIKTDEDLPF